ncbi:MAG: S-layer homology domain-containing protein [Tissierellia bacterium]|nr:S-layer homology domain-containing protein [Tissierellia bacterium]
MTFEKVNARVIEPYMPPAPMPKVAKLDVLEGPAHLHHSGISAYKSTFGLLFPNRRSYVEYMSYVGSTHKFYDERGQIYTGTVEDLRPRAVEANRRYVLDITLVLIKKDQYDKKDFFKFQDIEGHWAEEQISEMANLGILSVTTVDGDPVLYFRPNDFTTRGEFVAMLNRTRRLLEKVLRE